MARLGIEVATATAGTLSDGASVPAEVQVDPLRVAHVVPLVPGRLSTVHVQLGDTVESGDALAVLESVELGLARASLSEARALREVAQAHFDRQQRLRGDGITSERELIDSEGDLREAEARVTAARSTLEVYGGGRQSGASMTLASPLAGTIIEQHATTGEAVGTDASLFVIADLSHVWLIGRVYEQDLRFVSVGDEVVVTMRAYPGRTWPGRIDFVSPVLEEEPRTLSVRVEMDNASGELRPGMFGQMRLQPESGGTTAVIPESAVQTLEGRSVIFVPADHPGEFAAHPVVVGRAADGMVEVLGGLAPGDQFVALGAFALKSTLLAGELGHGHAH